MRPSKRKMETGEYCGPTPYQPLDSSQGGTGKTDNTRSGGSSCSSRSNSSNASGDGSGLLPGGGHGLNGSDGSPTPLISNTSRNGRSHHFDVSSESGGGSDGGGGGKTMSNAGRGAKKTISFWVSFRSITGKQIIVWYINID